MDSPVFFSGTYEFRGLGFLREFDDDSSVYFFFVFLLFRLIPFLIQFYLAILFSIVGVWDTENGRKKNGGSRDF